MTRCFRAINRHCRIATGLSDRAIALIVKRRAAVEMDEVVGGNICEPAGSVEVRANASPTTFPIEEWHGMGVKVGPGVSYWRGIT